jgi:hypothetical protein
MLRWWCCCCCFLCCCCCSPRECVSPPTATAAEESVKLHCVCSHSFSQLMSLRLREGTNAVILIIYSAVVEIVGSAPMLNCRRVLASTQHLMSACLFSKFNCHTHCLVQLFIVPFCLLFFHSPQGLCEPDAVMTEGTAAATVFCSTFEFQHSHSSRPFQL